MSAKFCSKCGKEANENEMFCSNCGNSLKEEKAGNSSPVQNTVNEAPKKGNGMSTAGFILGLCGFITCGLTSIIGLILSIIGLQDSKKNNRKDGLAVAGIVLSSIMFVPFALGFLGGMVEGITATDIKMPDFSTMKKEEAEKWCEDNNAKCDFSEDYSDEIPEGGFISQEYKAGEEIKSNKTIDIIYSKGAKPETPKEENNTKETKQETTKTAAEKKADYINSCGSYGYKDIARQPDEYKGKKAKFRGKIIQVKEDTWNENKVVLLVSVTQDEYGWWDDSVYVTYKYKDGESRVLEDDIITMYGTIEGTTSYYSVLGAKITIPSFTAKYIDLEQ